MPISVQSQSLWFSDAIIWDVQTTTLGVTLNSIFTIEDNTTYGDTTTTIYVGTYAETIYFRLNNNQSIESFSF